MTAQFQDLVTYRSNEYALAGIAGEGLFDPARHGLTPAAKGSACWRGFLCSYTVDDRALFLTDLWLSTDTPPPALFGTTPSIDRGKYGVFDYSYAALRMPVMFTGGLLLAKGFIQKLYVHMGFHPAWKYTDVHELTFDRGQLALETDRSGDVSKLRDMILQSGEGMGPALAEDVAHWIERTFSRHYDFWSA